MANEFVERAMDLIGRDFEYAKAQRKHVYKVRDVRMHPGNKIAIYCVSRTFVWTAEQLPAFLSEIRVMDENGPQKQAFVPDKEKITLKQNTMSDVIVQNHADNGVSVADKMTNSLMGMFETLAGNPTEADFKKAEAMSKVAHTVISIEQTKIRYLKLKNGK